MTEVEVYPKLSFETEASVSEPDSTVPLTEQKQQDQQPLVPLKLSNNRCTRRCSERCCLGLILYCFMVMSGILLAITVLASLALGDVQPQHVCVENMREVGHDSSRAPYSATAVCVNNTLHYVCSSPLDGVVQSTAVVDMLTAVTVLAPVGILLCVTILINFELNF